MTAHSEAIDKIERALCERYNISELDEPLAALIREARSSGSADLLKADLSARELYHWQKTIDETWAELGYAQEAASEKPLARMNKPELLALAAARNVEVPEGATVASLRDLLGDSASEVSSEPEPEEPVQPPAIHAIPEDEAPSEEEQEPSA